MVGKAQSQVAPPFPRGKNRGQVLTFGISWHGRFPRSPELPLLGPDDTLPSNMVQP